MTTPPAEPPRVGRHAAGRDAQDPAPARTPPTPATPATPARSAHAAVPSRTSPPATTQSPSTIGDLLATMSEVAREAGRNDLVSRLDGARTRITDPRLRIVVVGQLKQGKSSFVNALLNLDVCSVGDDETTAVPTVISHARSRRLI